jgi:hypothetical protein
MKGKVTCPHCKAVYWIQEAFVHCSGEFVMISCGQCKEFCTDFDSDVSVGLKTYNTQDYLLREMCQVFNGVLVVIQRKEI